MGVKHLWDIIDETKNKESLEYLRGKVVSVDLSIWIVEAIKTLQFKTSILKPHLRNIFYRILALRKLGIKLLFVTEGEAPDLKQNTMKKRNEQRYGVKSKTKNRVGRSRFQNTIKECCQLLDLLGMPYVKAAGEAEAMCAALNLHKYSDGCLTNDGDFFLYGGQTIFRDFGIDPKDPHVFVYHTADIESRLKITRRDMVGIALLTGCDYTEGVAGVGKGLIKNFLKERTFKGDLLSRFEDWQHKDFLTAECVVKSELMVARKAMKCDNILNHQIIDEYLVNKDSFNGIKEKLKWGYPNIRGLQEFLNEKMEWPFEYTISKIMQLASSTYLEKTADNLFYPVIITPSHIVKTRCQYGVSLVEINWEKDPSLLYHSDMRWENCPETFNTIENHQVVLKVLPELVEKFIQLKEAKNKKKGKKGKKVKDDQVDSENIESTQSQSSQDYQESQDLGCGKPPPTDFLSDVLCKSMRDISLNNNELTNLVADKQSGDKKCVDTEIKKDTKINLCFDTSDNLILNHAMEQYFESSDEENKENALPLLQRMQRKVIKEKRTRYNPFKISSEPCTKSNLKPTELSKDVVSDQISAELIQKEHLISDNPVIDCMNDSVLISIPSTPTLKVTKAADNHTKEFTTPKTKTNLNDCSNSILLENTPECHYYKTPMLETKASKTCNVNCTSTLSSSTPMYRDGKCSTGRTPKLQDITNFSNLGDSILDHSMDLFDSSRPLANSLLNDSHTSPKNNKSNFYESLDLNNTGPLISKMSGFDDSILCESLDLANVNSPLRRNYSRGDNDDSTRKVKSSQLSYNYEELLRKKFEISLNCDDNSMTNVLKSSPESSRISNVSSVLDGGSPLCLADRLRIK